MAGNLSVLYRPGWQRLRVSFLARNSPLGGFVNPPGTEDNLNRLNNYIQDAAPSNWELAQAPEYVQQECMRMQLTIEQEHACRVWRGLNMLNAVRMGFNGTALVGTEMDRAVTAYRDQLQEFHNPHAVDQAERAWNWDVVIFELEEMWRNERFWFTKIHEDLQKRDKEATRRKSSQVIGSRTELRHFLALMDQVNRIP